MNDLLGIIYYFVTIVIYLKYDQKNWNRILLTICSALTHFTLYIVIWAFSVTYHPCFIAKLVGWFLKYNLFSSQKFSMWHPQQQLYYYHKIKVKQSFFFIFYAYLRDFSNLATHKDLCSSKKSCEAGKALQNVSKSSQNLLTKFYH